MWSVIFYLIFIFCALLCMIGTGTGAAIAWLLLLSYYYIKLLSHYLPEGTEENYKENLVQDNWPPRWDSNWIGQNSPCLILSKVIQTIIWNFDRFICSSNLRSLCSLTWIRLLFLCKTFMLYCYMKLLVYLVVNN